MRIKTFAQPKVRIITFAQPEVRITTFAQPKVRISIWSYADLWFRDLYRQLAILVAAPYDFGLPFGQQMVTGFLEVFGTSRQ